MTPFLKILAEGRTLTQSEAEQAMHLMMKGEASPESVAGFLMGLRTRGETIDELTGFTKIMREYMIKVDSPDPNTIDVCGTGGDHAGTFNISTTVALVCAGAGVTMAKHGNRSVSSKSGSADVLAVLGVETNLGKAGVEACLKEAGIAFLFAPAFHPALKHVGPIRRALAVRTFFNLLGPMCNPAQVDRQFVGVFGKKESEQVAEILNRLGTKRVMAVHAEDGLDEISPAGRTFITEIEDNQTKSKLVSPKDLGFDPISLSEIQGGSAEENAEIMTHILSGKPSKHRNVVVLNTAYALQVTGKYATLQDSLEAANLSLDSGAAKQKLKALIEVSND